MPLCVAASQSMPAATPPTAPIAGPLAGGLGGAGVGALVGSAVHHPLAGALVGAGVGAASGAAIGGAIDQSEANNRALIEARLGHAVQPGAVTVGDVINMSRAGVPENVIITHVQKSWRGRAASVRTT